MKGFPKNLIDLTLIQEINQLWHPVYPYLAEEISQFYGRKDGNLLEMGPFCGVIFYLLKRKVGNAFTIATFPSKMGQFFIEEAQRQKALHEIRIVETDPSLKGIEGGSMDLVIFRGAFFFPSLFEVNYSAIHQVLKKGGMAFIGGGFGKLTPEEVRRKIGDRSRELNLQIGKVVVNQEKIREEVEKSCFKGNVEFISEGGLWVVLKT
ncbi:MAG: hypothetical protein ACPL6D_03620 [Thermodesulfobacteriota bacterium]